MEVKVKYQIISRATISSISYNHPYGLLAMVADGNDTASFFSLSPELSLMPRFSGESKPPSSGNITWSPNGLYVIVANVKVQLWKFEGNRMCPLRVVNQGFIQIKGIAWSQDSQYYLCYGITPKDTPLSINIRHLQTNQLRQIITSQLPILANFDPFGKYIAVMMINNSLDLYDSRTLEKVRSISLAQGKNDVPTLRDKRIADWSPQYSYFACPNLNDSKIPTTVIFDRNRNFLTKQILVGHHASISCTKFSPQIYEFQSDITFILAVGDSSGCLSLWRIGRTNSYRQPLFIASSPNVAEQSIEQIQWNSQGQILFINVLKKYVVIMNIKSQYFGRRLSQQQKSNLIVGTYGASGVNQITSTKLQIFGQNDLSLKNELQIQQPPKTINLQDSFQKNITQIPQNKPKQTMITTKQQTIINKDSNNRQKKRIIPSRIIPQSQLNKQAELAKMKQSSMIQISSSGSTIMLQKQKIPTIRIPSLKQDIKKQYYLPNQQILQVQNSKNIYIMSIRQKRYHNLTQKQNKAKRFFTGQIKNIQITNQNILVINSQKLFIFDLDLKVIELPCYVGDISNFTVNNSGTVFYMTTNGYIKGFNYLRHELLLETSISYLFMSNQFIGNTNANNNNQVVLTSNPLLLFNVFDEDCDRLHVQVQFKNSLSRYFFCRNTNSWIEFDFQQGFYLPGHSLRITKTQSYTAKNFYTNIVTPAISSTNFAIPTPTSTLSSSTSPTLTPFQLQLIYYRKYTKDIHKFKDSLVRMISDLKVKGQDEQLRKLIIDYFVDRNSDSYIDDVDLWEKVRKIGGRVIQEFLMLEKI